MSISRLSAALVAAFLLMICWSATEGLRAPHRAPEISSPVKNRVTAPTAFAGDSLAQGMAIALGFTAPANNQTRVGAFTRELPGMLSRLPTGAVVGVSMGTNDATGGKVRMAEVMASALKVAAERNQILVWYGPPSFDLKWGANARDISDQIEKALADTPHRFVKTNDHVWPAGMRAADRVHFTLAGYRALYTLGGFQ